MSTGDKYITAHANADAALVIARLTAENARMRRALDMIASSPLTVPAVVVVEHARRALADADGKEEG